MHKEQTTPFDSDSQPFRFVGEGNPRMSWLVSYPIRYNARFLLNKRTNLTDDILLSRVFESKYRNTTISNDIAYV